MTSSITLSSFSYNKDLGILKILLKDPITNHIKNVTGRWISITKRQKMFDDQLIDWEKEINSCLKSWDWKESFAEKFTKELCLKYNLTSDTFTNLSNSDIENLFNNSSPMPVDLNLTDLISKIQYYNDHYLELKDTDENAMQDVRLEKLKEINPKHPLLKYVASDLNWKRSKIKHKHKMLSLEKITNDTWKVVKWGTKFASKIVLAEPKLDWHSLSLTYKDGKLDFGATRWNWTEWNIVTDHLAYINNIPKTIPMMGELEIRGEVVIKNSDFESLKDKFENPRNGISLSMKEPSETAERKLSFIWYNIFVNWNKYYYDESDKIEKVRELWFETFDKKDYFLIDITDSENIDKIIHTFDAYRVPNTEFDINIDGIVFKINSAEEQSNFGENDHDPNWAIAYKYIPEEAVTELLDIDWDVSKDWNLIPVWMLKPVSLSWTTVWRVTLNNFKNVVESDIKKWDILVVRKSWEIIPYLVSNSTAIARNISQVEKNQEYSNIISYLNKNNYLQEWCPSCWNKNFIMEWVHLKCMNENCIGVKKKSIIHFVKTLKIDFLGEGIIEKLLEQGVIKDYEDIFDLQANKLIWLDWFQEWLSNKIVKSISDAKKNIKIEVLLKAMGMDNLGERNSKRLLSMYWSLKNLLENIKPEEIKTIEGIWELNSIYYSNILIKNKEKITKLFEKLGLLDQNIVSDKKSDKLSWKLFCLTWTMSKGREEIELDIEQHGWKIGWVNKKLNYLVCWIGWWSKKDKVEELNSLWNADIKIITEEELIAMF